MFFIFLFENYTSVKNISITQKIARKSDSLKQSFFETIAEELEELNYNSDKMQLTTKELTAI